MFNPKIKNIALVIGFIFACSFQAFAGPAITGVSGPLTDGSSLTISGSGFGVGNNTPLLWDNFESGTVGNVLNSNPEIGSWVPGSSPAYYSNALSHSGTQSEHEPCVMGSGQACWSSITVNLPDADKFYQSFWFYYDTHGDNSGDIKLVQVFGNGPNGQTPMTEAKAPTTTWWYGDVFSESLVTLQQDWVAPYGSGVTQKAWHHYEHYIKRSSAGGVADGSVTQILDGTIVFNKQNAVTRDSSSYNWIQTSFLHGIVNFNVGSSIDAYVDDVYLNNTWARVIISDSPTFSGVTHNEVQLPTAWADTSVTITLNKGSFSNLNNEFLYVIDLNRNVNANGFSLCGSCPAPPTKVSVQ